MMEIIIGLIIFIIGCLFGVSTMALSMANTRRQEYTEQVKLQRECDYWEREAKKWCGKLGNAKLKIAQKLCEHEI